MEIESLNLKGASFAYGTWRFRQGVQFKNEYSINIPLSAGDTSIILRWN